MHLKPPAMEHPNKSEGETAAAIVFERGTHNLLHTQKTKTVNGLLFLPVLMRVVVHYIVRWCSVGFSRPDHKSSSPKMTKKTHFFRQFTKQIMRAPLYILT